MADARRPPPAPRKLDRGIRPKLVPIPPFNTYPREEAIKYLRNIFNTLISKLKPDKLAIDDINGINDTINNIQIMENNIYE